MTCEKARHSIPLIAGGELPERKARRLRKHLEKCAVCQKELSEFRAVLANLKSFLREDELDWEDGDWRRLMQRVTAEKPEPGGLLLGLSIGKAWAYGLLVVSVLGLAAISLRTIIGHRKNAGVGENIIFTRTQPSRTFDLGSTTGSRVEDRPFITRAPKQKRPGAETTLQAALPEKIPAQERLNITLISKVSGLRVHWTFNKNFEWEERGK